MTLKQASSFLRLWPRTTLVHGRRIAPILAVSVCRPLLSYRPYAKYTHKKAPPTPCYQSPTIGSKWYSAIVNWAQTPWREKLWSAWRGIPTMLKFTLHIFNFACATHFFLTYVAGVTPMVGPSMLPTFAAWGDIIVEDKITYTLFPERLARGDVITVESPLERGHKICKRVLGLPGDIVCVDPTGRYAPCDEHVIIPKGHIWIIGDNASMSRDSRHYGPVPVALVKGRVLARVWPPSRIALFPGHDSVAQLS